MQNQLNELLQKEFIWPSVPLLGVLALPVKKKNKTSDMYWLQRVNL